MTFKTFFPRAKTVSVREGLAFAAFNYEHDANPRAMFDFLSAFEYSRLKPAKDRKYWISTMKGTVAVDVFDQYE